MTIPDLWDEIKYKYRKFIDIPLSWMEHWGSKMGNYAWQKRWCDRQKGTGYDRDRFIK